MSSRKYPALLAPIFQCSAAEENLLNTERMMI